MNFQIIRQVMSGKGPKYSYSIQDSKGNNAFPSERFPESGYLAWNKSGAVSVLNYINTHGLTKTAKKLQHFHNQDFFGFTFEHWKLESIPKTCADIPSDIFEEAKTAWLKEV